MEQLIVSSEEDLRRIIAEEIGKVIGTMQPKEETRYLTRKQAAALIHITLPTLRKWVINSTIKEHRIGTRILYSQNDVEQAIKERAYKRGGK